MKNALNPEIKSRVTDLLSEMTLEEKIGQMCMHPGEPADIGFDDITLEQVSSDIEIYKSKMSDLAEQVVAGKIGSFVKVPGSKAVAHLQECAKKSRLGIPLLISTDAIHGHTMYTSPATVFPTPISTAASFDTRLASRIGEATAAEMRATGYHWSFAPNVDVVRDQRWGRTGETFGEDPLLVALMGEAVVEGMQGDLGPERVAACAKHFVGSGEPFNGINGSEIDISDRTMESVYLPPFRRAVASGVRSIMPAHHAVNGVPCHAHKAYLRDLLCDEWGFDGIVASDWMDIGRLHSSQRVAADFAEACEMAVNAGIDVYVAGVGFYETMLESVRAGRVPETRIDEAVSRILTVKFELGLFEEEPVFDRETTTLRCEKHLEIAREGAEKSLVLLKNDASLLPLTTYEKRTILVTGPLSHTATCLGDWVKTIQQKGVETIYDALCDAKPANWDIDLAECGTVMGTQDSHIDHAVELAGKADVIVACVGENSFRWSEEPKTSGENCDRADLSLPGRQVELISRLAATGKPVAAVIITSRANAIPVIAEKAGAILMAWEPGMFTARAVAEALFGKFSPSGRLPISIPRSSGHIKCLYDRPPLRLSRYGDSEETPLFAFGFGLSYSEIAYANLDHTPRITRNDVLEISLDVTNEGSFETDHIVPVFFRDTVSSVTTPERKLCGFTRIESLEPGECRRITIWVAADNFALIDASAHRVLEPGNFELFIGDLQSNFEIIRE